MTQEINEAGIALIKRHELCVLKPYLDPVGIWTIGWGHTGEVAGVPLGGASAPLTQAQADALLLSDLDSAEDIVDDFLSGLPVKINSNQYSALVSLSFNCGEGPLRGTLGTLMQNNLFPAAADEFLRWNHAGGRVLDGLTKRREEERELFLTPVEEQGF